MKPEGSWNGNGMRIPLLVDTGMFIAGLIAAVFMYKDIQALKESKVTEATVVRIEERQVSQTAILQRVEAQVQRLERRLDEEDRRR